MCDAFSFERGRILFEKADIYPDFFNEARSKTAEHTIDERAGKSFYQKNEKTQKLKKSEEN